MSRPSFQRKTEQAGTGAKILLLAVVLLGVAAGAFWYSQHGSVTNPAAAGSGGLSDGTKTVLKKLHAPVEIHFYSLLDKASVPAGTFAFAGRINDLLAEYQQAGGGKISVTRFKASADADAASADGLKPFNLDKGDACYLGLAVSCKGRKESFPQLSADWEAAFEADLSRAIARLSSVQPSLPAVATVSLSTPTAAAIDDLKRALPNLASVSVAEGTQVLREAALADFKAAVTEMQNQIEDARQRLADAQKNDSEADQQGAMKEFQQLQAAQSEKIKQIAARLQLQIATLEQIKKQ